VTGPGGSDPETKTDYITVYAAPVANFSGSPLSGGTATSFTFTNASTGNITSYSWDFGSGASPATASTVGPHSVTYSTTGAKTISLTVTGPGGSDDETKTDYINVSSAVPAPVAEFSGSPRSAVEPPLTVTFTDESTGNITSWAWDFDNNGSVDSTEQSPSYEYASAGRYTVKLTVTGPGGSDSETKTDYIRVINSANRIYVSTAGNDSSDGSTWALAKKTIQAGITAASDDYAVLVGPGTYSGTGNINLDFAQGVTPPAPGKAIHLKGVFGPFFEGFESGNLTANSWAFSGWTASSVDKHSGTYSARSARTSTGTDYINKSFTVEAGDGSVTFWWKASLNSTSYLRFLVDTVEQARDSSTAWSSYTYSLSEGSHTLRWECVRGAAGLITAYLDDIQVTNTSTGGWVIDGGNTAGNRGFYFHTSETAHSVVDNFTIQRCTALGGEDGGGIYCTGASPTIIYSSIGGATYGNKGDNGGGICCYGGSNPTITDCTIKRNAATAGDGGGIYCDASSPRISGCTIGVAGGANTATGNNGGGIYCCNNSNPRITACTIDSNEADGGGGIYCDSSSPLISGCTIKDNLASGAAGTGGGIYLFTGSNVTITNCAMSGNSAAYYGGGIYSERSTPTITGCRIGADGANTSGELGGGISLYISSAVITNCTIMNNTALKLGGGMDCWNNSNAAITNCLIANNSTTSAASGDGNGGGIDIYEASPTLNNCTVANNMATNNGGGMNCFISTPVLNNTIVWGNIADSDTSTEGLGNQIYADRSELTPCTVTLNYSDYADNSIDSNNIKGSGTVTANNCIVSDPLFVDAGSGDYHLQSTSPCVDAGSNALVPAGITTDLDGPPKVRIYNSVVDMGAYEYQP
jgi:PKD repeat protein